MLQFGTKFKEMAPNSPLFGQSTVGMWVSKSLKQKGTTVLVIDNEGCDSHERTDEHMQSLERRYGLMALRASDILMLNLNCQVAGQDHGANLTLIKTMIEVWAVQTCLHPGLAMYSLYCFGYCPGTAA